MLQSLRSRRNRKGFTLAELLIVVAIIAVLVAIAVPLFIGALNRAEESAKNANIRAVRGEAVAVILMDESGKFMYTDPTTQKVQAKYWTVEATVSKTGGVTINKIVPAAAVPSEVGTDTAVKGSTGYTVTVYIQEEDLSKISNA